MNYKDKLLNIIDFIYAEEEHFCEYFAGNQKDLLGNYDNWSYKDVIAHTSEWRLIASKKLELIKKGEYVSFHENLDAINITNYMKHKDDSIKEIILLLKNSYELLRGKIEVFCSSELADQNKLQGFNAPLWRYVIIDGFLHPVVHIAYFYFRNQEFQRAFKILEENLPIILDLDSSEEIIHNYFDFGDLLQCLKNDKDFIEKFKDFYTNNKSIANGILNNFKIINNF